MKTIGGSLSLIQWFLPFNTLNSVGVHASDIQWGVDESKVRRRWRSLATRSYVHCNRRWNSSYRCCLMLGRACIAMRHGLQALHKGMWKVGDNLAQSLRHFTLALRKDSPGISSCMAVGLHLVYWGVHLTPLSRTCVWCGLSWELVVFALTAGFPLMTHHVQTLPAVTFCNTQSLRTWLFYLSKGGWLLLHYPFTSPFLAD